MKTNETLLNVFDITLLSVWKTDQTLVNVFDITLLSVWKTDETLVNVFDVSLHGAWLLYRTTKYPIWRGVLSLRYREQLSLSWNSLDCKIMRAREMSLSLELTFTS